MPLDETGQAWGGRWVSSGMGLRPGMGQGKELDQSCIFVAVGYREGQACGRGGM